MKEKNPEHLWTVCQIERGESQLILLYTVCVPEKTG